MTTATDTRLRGPHTADGRRILAFCSWLVEAGDTLIDNRGKWWTALGRAYREDGCNLIDACLYGHGGGQRSALPVDDFRYGHRIERSK